MSSTKNKLISAQSNYANTNAQINTALINLRTATFCYITKVDSELQIINCRPVVKESITNKTGSSYIKLPEFINIPYMQTNRTPRINEYCLCIHLDRSVQELFSKRKDLLRQGLPAYTTEDLMPHINSNGTKHTLNDCIAFVNIFYDVSTDPNAYVTLGTEQTITGKKTFEEVITANGGIESNNIKCNTLNVNNKITSNGPITVNNSYIDLINGNNSCRLQLNSDGELEFIMG